MAAHLFLRKLMVSEETNEYFHNHTNEWRFIGRVCFLKGWFCEDMFEERLKECLTVDL